LEETDLERIKSFEIDHNLLDPGFYISREDGDIITYDLRTRKPNAGDYMSNIAMHSVEHMFATYVRNSEIASDVIYFGPMGCQTGFYLLVRNQKPLDVFQITKKVLEQILSYEGPVFGATAVECGNYRNLSLDEAKQECRRYLEVINKQTNMEFTYPKGE
jgi:S-ribosylhomocysteine lyase